MTLPTTPRAMNAEEAGRFVAQLLGLPEPLSKEYVWRLTRRGAIPHKRLGGRLWYRDTDLAEFVEQGGSLF
jgi:hypothetical protein